MYIDKKRNVCYSYGAKQKRERVICKIRVLMRMQDLIVCFSVQLGLYFYANERGCINADFEHLE